VPVAGEARRVRVDAFVAIDEPERDERREKGRLRGRREQVGALQGRSLRRLLS
jgi:hypothetical protein